MNKLLDKYKKKNYNRIVTHDYQLHNFMVKYINIASVLGTKTLYLANLRKLGEGVAVIQWDFPILSLSEYQKPVSQQLCTIKTLHLHTSRTAYVQNFETKTSGKYQTFPCST